ncbi:MAG: HAMP domain-containing sensor histidine kinase [Bacteroidales bacterium]|jgi:K+-sensing histidine kinase KdpD|nr:HAMP domain-containing sensor histidine kinase [Bacteroidales bacterium]
MTFGRNTEKVSHAVDKGKPGEKSHIQQNDMLTTPSILTGLSHEVRTYMNSIVAFTFLSNNDSCTDEQRDEYNRHIMKSCDQLITLFDNFLDSALIDSEIPRSTYTKCKLNTLLEDLLDDINSSISRFDKKKVTLLLDERSGGDSIYIDKEKINRVLKNLFFNAFENTDAGYIRMGYRKQKNRVDFYIIDSGNGYTKNQQLLACDNFEEELVQNQNTFNTVSFMLSRKLIESMNGELWIRPNGVHGTAMYFSVPEPRVMKEGTSEHISSRIAI